jgi:3-dehydroquinate dehydratase type I
MFCIPIIAKNTKEAFEKIYRASFLADILEIRLDLMEDFDLGEIVKASNRPLLVTYRSVKEGGEGNADPEMHAEYLLSAIQSGAAFVDVELSLPVKLREKIICSAGRTETVLSTHIMDATPSREELNKIYRDCTAMGADIVKIVTWAGNWADNLRVLELIPHARKFAVKISAFCMGPMGRISRVFSHLLGGYITFVALDRQEEFAKGQICLQDMKKILGIISP